jgi:2-keto-4-pentenoate hydratase
LAPRAEPYTRADVIAAVGSVMPAFEIVSPRFTSLMLDDVASVVADGGLNGAIALGPATTDWRELDLPAHAVTVAINGHDTAKGTGANVMGDPVNVLAWTANHYRQRGITLEAGQFISTGATTGLLFLEPDQTIRADYGSLGAVELTFTPPRADVTVVRP